MLDKHGNLLEKHQQVVVPEPKGTDRHKRSFIGTIIAVLDSRGTAMVEDDPYAGINSCDALRIMDGVIPDPTLAAA